MNGSENAMFAIGLSLFFIAAEPEARPVEQINSLRDLWMACRWYGLPLPPRDARLIYLGGDGEAPSRDSFGWVTHPSTDSSAAIVMTSYGNELLEHRKSILYGTPVSIQHFKRSSFYRPWYPWREIAVHCWQNGQSDLAEYAFKECEKEWQIALLPPLRLEAWHYWYRRAFEKNSDRQQALLYLHRIAMESQEPREKNLVEKLAFTLRPALSRPGSVDAAIDNLVDANSAAEYYSINGSNHIWDFDSLPYLIQHFDDQRLTRHLRFEGGCMASFHEETVGDACKDIAWNLLGRRKFGRDIKLANCLDYLTEIRKNGEEDWCATNLLSSNVLLFFSGQNTTLLDILRTKYPQRLVKIFDDTPLNENNWQLAHDLLVAIFKSRLPRETKRRCLDRMLSDQSFETRWIGINLLEHYAPGELKVQIPKLLRSIETAGKDDAAAQSILCKLLRLIAFVNSDDLWMAYTKQVMTLPAIEKYALVADVESIWQGRLPGQRRGPLLFLKSFLNDEEIIDLPKNYRSQFPFEGCQAYCPTRMQNMAAIHVGWIFDKEVPLKRTRPDCDWEAICEDMTVLLDERLKSLAARTP